jgi:hypothetical protein
MVAARVFRNEKGLSYGATISPAPVDAMGVVRLLGKQQPDK